MRGQSDHRYSQLLDPQADGIPGAPDQPSLFNGLECKQRHIGQGLIAVADLQDTNLLTFFDRGNQRIWTNDLGFDFSRAAGGDGNHNGLSLPELGKRLAAFPDRGRNNRLIGIKQLHGLECGVAPIQEFLGFVGACVLAGGAQEQWTAAGVRPRIQANRQRHPGFPDQESPAWPSQ